MINRQKLIEELEPLRKQAWEKYIEYAEPENFYHEGCYDEIMRVIDIIESQPPADVPDTNVGEWIPCSSGKMPEHNQRVATTHLLHRELRHLSTAVYFKEKGRLIDYEWRGEGFYQYSDGDYILRDDVIAWMPAEPYMGAE